MNEHVSTKYTDDEIDNMLEALWDDYEVIDSDLLEKYYKQGWNDAIEHIQDFLDRTKQN